MATKVISFFSYKGGAGRTTLLYNCLPLLLNEHIKPTKEAPVVLVDMDIDSCGLSYLLGVQADQIHEDACVQYVLSNGVDPNKSRVEDYPIMKKLIPVGNPLGYADNEAVLFLPAKDNRNVKSEIRFIYVDDNFEKHMESFVDACKKCNLPAVIMDSAVGNQVTALVANHLSKLIVCCMRPTIQFVEGTARYLQTQDSDNATVTGYRNCILVPNVVPQGEVVIDNLKYPSYAIKRFYQIFSDFIEDRDEMEDWQYNTEMLDGDTFGIPAVPSFMWREGQLYTQKVLDDNEKLALECYRKLAGIIAKL